MPLLDAEDTVEGPGVGVGGGGGKITPITSPTTGHSSSTDSVTLLIVLLLDNCF